MQWFGPLRCMFESNIPADKVTCSYQVLWKGFKRLAAQFSPGEKQALFDDSAAKSYFGTGDSRPAAPSP